MLKCKPCKGLGRGGHKGCEWICPHCNGLGIEYSELEQVAKDLWEQLTYDYALSYGNSTSEAAQKDIVNCIAKFLRHIQ